MLASQIQKHIKKIIQLDQVRVTQEMKDVQHKKINPH